MTRQAVLGAGVVLMLCAGSWAEPDWELRARYWMPQIQGSSLVNEAGLPAITIDLNNDLAIGDESIPEGQVVWNISPLHHVRAGYSRVDFSGTNTLIRTINYSGTTFAVGTTVTSQLDLQTFDFGYGYTLGRNDHFRLDALFDVRVLNIDASIQSTIPPLNEAENVTVPLPTVGVGFKADVHNYVGVVGEVNAMTAGDYGYFVDAEIGIEIKPWEHISILGGYRYLDFKGRDPNDADYLYVNLSGPFINVYGSF